METRRYQAEALREEIETPFTRESLKARLRKACLSASAIAHLYCVLGAE
jgi:hypothetical protein